MCRYLRRVYRLRVTTRRRCRTTSRCKQVTRGDSKYRDSSHFGLTCATSTQLTTRSRLNYSQIQSPCVRRCTSFFEYELGGTHKCVRIPVGAVRISPELKKKLTSASDWPVTKSVFWIGLCMPMSYTGADPLHAKHSRILRQGVNYRAICSWCVTIAYLHFKLPRKLTHCLVVV